MDDGDEDKLVRLSDFSDEDLWDMISEANKMKFSVEQIYSAWVEGEIVASLTAECGETGLVIEPIGSK